MTRRQCHVNAKLHSEVRRCSTFPADISHDAFPKLSMRQYKSLHFISTFCESILSTQSPPPKPSDDRSVEFRARQKGAVVQPGGKRTTYGDVDVHRDCSSQQLCPSLILISLTCTSYVVNVRSAAIGLVVSRVDFRTEKRYRRATFRDSSHSWASERLHRSPRLQ